MSPPQKDTREILERTRMCKYWKAKRCTLGADCKFAHSVAELKQQPDLVATQLCFQFTRKGRCKNGEACKFAHGRSELRRFPNASSNETPTKAHKEQSLRKGESHETPSIVPPLLQSGVVQILPGQSAQSDPEPEVLPPPSLFPPGLEPCWTTPSAAALQDLAVFNAIDRMSFASAQQLVSQGYTRRKSPLSHQGSMDLPLTLDRSLSKSHDREGTDSASTTWLSGCPSDSEPASPMCGRFWL
ncbi:Tristetraprolin [Symbiodinium microadriaticum]|uniref:Tristetraprolin n=1 Tax=Symbiodinium microadriaticum TaxID=2951 RepID=A0A1Q9E7P1_SYMMI|nr:Tristetraprolin [Symbiodinium microadriaticum]CAE7873692.1 Zfp36 [Symbiodinium microadriaticum]CAE7878281.1 Zfp36 [Symbiodinium sp. KB8]